MTPERFRQVKELFIQARHRPPAERPAFLARVCGSDVGLLQEVETLLAAEGNLLTITDASRGQPMASELSQVGREGRTETDRIPAWPEEIGPYRILDRLGEGGMGSVYLAEQHEPLRRRVALKLVKPGMDSREVLMRFDSERQALALLSHPNVASVFDAGTSAQGHPYFVMEYVPGVPICDYCDQHRLTTRARLELFMPVCRAVQHAHQKGIIHRDLKPSNILVALEEGQPVPKVIDFGIAKATRQPLMERATVTQPGQLIGTPEYMSPEQAATGGADVDTRSDIYALGVILYELLTGALPLAPEALHTGGLEELIRAIREQEPPKPSTRLSALGAESTKIAENRRVDAATLVRQLRGDLDWIVMKALEKDRARRYETAHALELDLRRHLDHEAVHARPPRRTYRLSKFIGRNKAAVGAVAGFVLVLTVGLVFSLTSWREAVRERDRAQEVTRFVQEMLAGISPEVAKGLDTALMRMILDVAAKRIEEELVDRPVIEASLRNTIGTTYVAIGEYTLAEPHLQEALRIRDEQLGGEHEDTLISMRDLAALRYEQGRFDDALDLLETTLERRREILGAEDPATLRTMTDLGWLSVRAQRYDEAEALLSQALEAQRRLLGSEHPDTLESMNDLGLLFYYARLDYVRYGRQEYVWSEQLLRQVLETRRASLGDDHPRTLYAMNNLSLPLAAQGKFDEAASLLRQALETRQRLLGPKHSLTLGTLGNLAELHRNWGKREEAESLYRDALDGYRELLGDQHPDTLTCMNNLALVLQSLQKYEQAAELLKHTIEKRTRVLGATHAYTLGSMFHLAWTYYLANKPASAEPVLRQVLAGYEQTLGDEEPLTLLCMYKLALVLQGLQRYGEAEEFFLRSINGRKKVLGEAHEYTLGTMVRLGWMYLEWGKPELAEPLLQSTVELAQAALPAGDYRTATFRYARGACLTKLERWTEAEAQLLASQRDLATWNSDHPDAGRAAQLLGELYDAWHAAEPDAGHDAQAAEWRAKLEQWQAKTQAAATQP